MNIADQRIIKDLGEKFRKTIRKTIRAFDSQLQPLFQVLKETILDIFTNFIKIQDEQIQQELIQACFNKYSSKFEDINYRFVLIALDYIFNKSNETKFNSNINYKYLTLIFVEQLKKYFHDNSIRSLNSLYQKLELLRKEKEIEELEEGFHDAYDDDEDFNQTQQNQYFKTQTNNQDYTSLYIYTKQDLQDKEDLIKSLTIKLQQREKNLIDITTGYIKDLQLLREQLFRQENNYEESYQVSYMDVTEILDPKLRELINIHLDDMKLQYNNKTRQIQKIVDQLKGEIKSLKIQNSTLANLTKTMDTPFDMIAKAFRFEHDPYKLWKIIQDLKGNYFFKEVFENQKPSYGINYREVNNLMMTSKAYEREFIFSKQQLQDQMIMFYNSSLNQIQSLRKSLELKEQELQTQKDVYLSFRDQVTFEVKQLMEKINNEELSEIKQNYQLSLKLFQNESLQMDRYKMKIVYKLWAILAKVKNLENKIFVLKPENIIDCVKKIMISGSFLTDQQIEQNEKFKKMQEQLIQIKNQNNELLMKNMHLQSQYKFYQTKWEAKQFEVDEARKKLEIIYQMKNQIEQEKQMIENYCKQLTILIDPKMINVQLLDNQILKIRLQDINLMDLSSPLIEDFCSKIKNLDAKRKNQIKEISEQAFKNKIAFESLTMSKFLIDQSTQTDQIKESQEEEEKKSANLSELLKQSQLNEIKSDFSGSQLPQSNQQRLKYQIEVKELDGTVTSQQIVSQEKVNSQYITDELTEKEILLGEIKELQKELLKFQKQQLQLQIDNRPKSQVRSRGISQQNTIGNIINMELEPQKQDQFVARIHSNQKCTSHEENLKTEEGNLSSNKVQINLKKQSPDKGDLEFNVEGNRQNISKREQRLKQLQQTANVLITNLVEPLTEEVNDGKKQQNLHKYQQLSKLKEKEQLKVFLRLFNQSRVKAEQIKQLKFNLQCLEKSHWEDILAIFNNHQIENEIQEFEVTQNIKINEQIEQNNLPSFQRKTTQEYYDKVKEKTDQIEASNNQNIYLNWFGRKRIQMDKMIENLDTIQKKKNLLLL